MFRTRCLHIQLIQMIEDGRGTYYFAERTSPPLGLLSIATYLSKYLPSVNIDIFDNATMDTKDIYNRIGADIVGFSVNLWNYNKSLEAALLAKSKGSIVVFGGHHASAVATNILKNREYVDYVVIGDGEVAFSKLVKGDEPSTINNLAFKDLYSDKIIINNIESLPLNTIPIPERSFVNLDSYVQNYKKTLPDSPHNTFTTFYSHKGCDFKVKNEACMFCGIATKGYHFRDPKESWNELTYLSQTFKINYIMDVGDNISRRWLRSFVKEKPNNINIAYTGYIRSDYIDEEISQLLAQIPCYSIFTGIESGDEDILRLSGKHTTPQNNLKSIEMLSNVGINVRLGIILGLLGENRQSIDRTIKHIEDILKIGNVEGIYTSLLVPLPGSRAFTTLVNYNGWKNKYLKSDVFDMETLKQQWVKSFTTVPYDLLLSMEEKIKGMSTPICQ